MRLSLTSSSADDNPPTAMATATATATAISISSTSNPFRMHFVVSCLSSSRFRCERPSRMLLWTLPMLFNRWTFKDVQVKLYELFLSANQWSKFLSMTNSSYCRCCDQQCPREDATRIGSTGVVRRQAVDISPLRRVNQAIYLLTTSARESAFRNIKTIAECLADEPINAAKGSSNSYAIKKKDEIERVAKANR
ncbi:hypothetical protein LWI29_034514 [Acer saccharum]|uniref:Small ribosomal subunit protein uS7 domain-containing protein n=1 Tax=Acer saccharum TaxID=4024 RepID=A0AA39SK47_ACESA|nr:hypothetical protein LWI29_034514 [Acer saccharum]